MKSRRSEPAQNETVTLRPVFGIPPTTYVPVLLATAVLLALFFLLLLPGIRSNGALVTFEAVPEGSSVHVDGVRRGATPLEVFVEKGTRSVTLRRPGFEEERFEIDVPGRIFGSRVVPRRMSVERTLTPERTRRLGESAAREFSRRALVGEANAQYQFEPVLSQAVLDMTAARDETDTLLLHTLRDVHTEATLTDYLRAAALAEGSGQSFTGLQAVGMLRRIARYVEDNPRLAYLGDAALPGDIRSAFRESEWYSDTTAGLETEVLAASREGEPDVSPPEEVTVAGETFIEIPSQTFIMGPQAEAGPANEGALELPHIRQVERFFIMETEVTRSLYQRFVRERPQWAPSARDELVAAGETTPDYLNDWSDGFDGDESTRPVRFVSYHAAVAFCEWLTEQLPPAFDGFEARLPTEAEWEWAARLNASEGYDAVFADSAMSTPLPVGSSEPGKLGIYDLLGNVWEWTADWYHPAAYLVDGPPRYAGAQRVVRGGSWANDRRSIAVTTRGAQPPDWSTGFLGFRPVIAEIRP
ncbi:MAG: SUMF1/EgtB/PvdO family nonheme iron enzyme [Spirochaetaceae bacterium]